MTRPPSRRGAVKATPAAKYVCTRCGGDAFVAYACDKSGEKSWGGKIKPGERVCLPCGKKDGIGFFDRVPR